MERKWVNEGETGEGGVESGEDETGWGGSEHQAVVLICKFSQMTQRLWLCLPSPLPLHLHVPPLSRVSPDASLLSEGRQRHTAGKPGRLLVIISPLSTLPFTHCWHVQPLRTICQLWQGCCDLFGVSLWWFGAQSCTIIGLMRIYSSLGRRMAWCIRTNDAGFAKLSSGDFRSHMLFEHVGPVVSSQLSALF